MRIKKVLSYMFLLVILSFLVVLFFNIQNTYSKYLENIKVQAISGVAKPCFALKNQAVLEKDVLNLDVISYSFSVQNHEENKISETAFKYNVGFEFSQNDAPIIVKLYRIYENEEKEVELFENFTVSPESFGIKEESAEYKVDIYYDLASDKVMDKDLKVNVKVEAIQEEGINN